MKKLKYIFIALPLAIASVGCNKLKDFGDTNNNPDVTNDPAVSAFLIETEASLGGYAAQSRPGYYCEYFSETQYPDASLYSLPQLDFTGYYDGNLEDLQAILQKDVSNNESQVARILKDYIYWTVTDAWGDVPYSEALQGQANTTPAYDAQEDIYKGMIADLTDAVGSFDNSSLITGDNIYDGDVASWKKLGNSLRMLMALRLSNVYAGSSDYAATEFKAAMTDAGGYISDNSENFTVVYPGDAYTSPWYNTYNGRKDIAESATMTNMLSSFGDGRQDAYGATSTGAATTDGVPYGLARASVTDFINTHPNWAYVLNPSYRTESGASVAIVTAAEIDLARAEAADRGWTGENAETLYEAGVNASFDQWGLAAPSASYFTQTGVAFTAATGSGANLKQIATQRYLATYPDGLQGWCLWRRTGYPALTPAPDALNASGEIPRRYTYSTGEYSSNASSVAAAVSRLSGGDTQDSHIWWDQ